MSTIKTISNYYLVTRPDGSTIKCHNLATAKWYVRNPEAKQPLALSLYPTSPLHPCGDYMFIDRTFHNPTGHGPHTIVTVTNKLMGYKRQATIPSLLINGGMVHAYLNGRSLQDAFPTLNAAEREFILSGMNGKEQQGFFDPPYETIRFPIVDVK